MKRWLLAIAVLLIFTLIGATAVFDQARAARAVKFFETLKHTKGKFYGQPFTLLPWEGSIIRDVYGTLNDRGLRQFKFVYLEIPKKNGKSELAAGAGLFHLFADGERNGEVYGCAADRAQASIVFDVAVDMIDQVPALRKRAKIAASKKRITDLVSGSYYQVLSAEAFTKHGLNVSAVVFDELHAQPSRELWDVMTFGSGDARTQPIWWVITTAGDDPDRQSIGWEVHDYAQQLLAGEKVNPAWYVTIFGYDGDDIYNEDNWKKANPSLGATISIESIREAAVGAQAKPADERLFRWLRLNQWITTKLTTWLPLDLFEKTNGNWNRTDLIGLDCYMGLDLSSTTDLTALCVVFPPQDRNPEWRVIWECFIPEEEMRDRINRDHVKYDEWVAGSWVTATAGNQVDYTVIREKILAMAGIYKVKELGADLTFAAMLTQELAAEGITCVNIPQTYAEETDPLNQIEVLLKKGQMTHEASPTVSWAFGNASVAKNGNGQIKLVKEHRGKSVVRTKRIDPISAWVDAMARARFYESPARRSIYEERGVREI